MKLLFKKNGTVCGIYDETFDVRQLGDPEIHRASRVEPDKDGRWTADLSPVAGPNLGPFEKRSDAVKAELAYLDDHLEEIATRYRRRKNVLSGLSAWVCRLFCRMCGFRF